MRKSSAIRSWNARSAFYQMRARIFGVHSPAGVLCGIMTADAAANYFSIEPTGGAIVNSYCGRPGSAFQHGYFANMNGHPLAATIIGGASGDGWFYRKYSDGFIEQWGMLKQRSLVTPSSHFPLPFSMESIISSYRLSALCIKITFITYRCRRIPIQTQVSMLK